MSINKLEYHVLSPTRTNSRQRQPLRTEIIEYYSVIKRKETLTFVTTWMDLDGTVLCEICQTEKDKHRMISLVDGI